MSEVASWGLVGAGSVGNELMRQLGKDYVADRFTISPAPSFIMRSTGLMGPDGSTPLSVETLEEIDELPDVTFIAIPSSSDGKEAKDYITTVLERGKIAVTAEKGAIASHYEYLKDISSNFSRLGINATVGGGTRILEVAKQYAQDVDNITQIHLALNGTLSTIMSLVGPQFGSGMPLGQAVHQAVELGYAEPGSETPDEVLRAEAEGDIPKKTAIFFNVLQLGKTVIDWSDLSFDLTSEHVSHAVEEAKVRRFIVSLYSPGYLSRSAKCPEDDIIGGFDVMHDGWRLVGGFRHTDRNPLFSPLSSTTGPSNGAVIGLGPDETDGVYIAVGPGAGVRPTANTMIDDYIARR